MRSAGSPWIVIGRPRTVRNITGAEEDVARLFDPASIAVIGASSRPGALSWWPLHLLRHNGFKGTVLPINPQRESIDGVPCYRSLAELPTVPELAMIAMNAERTLDAVRECADAGVKAVVLPTQGFGELGEAGRSKELELASLAGPGKLRIVGTNTDGVGNLATGAIASIQPLFGEGIEPGPVAVATQSGATAGSLLVRLKREGVGCRLYASAGNETDLGLADYLSVMVQDPEVKLVLSFVEALRRPREFLAVAEMAAELDKPIALIKVGRSEQGARRAAAHTGALAGDDELYDAMFRSYGVMRVSELSELVAIARLRLAPARIRGRGVGILSVSGGQAGSIADKAMAMRIPVPAVSPETEERLSEILTFGTGFNPCDLTGEIATKPSLAAQVYEAFGQEEALSTIVYARKQLTGTAGVDAAVGIATAARKPGAAPLAIYAMDGAIAGKEREVYEQGGVPVFSSLNDLFVAIDRLADYQGFRSEGMARARMDAPRTSAIRELPAAGGIVSDAAAKAVLADYGLEFPRERLVTSVGAAVSTAEDFGYPVVLKVSSDRIPHKTEAGGVELGLRSADDVRLAYERIWANAERFLGDLEIDGVLVQEQVQRGVELIAGVKVDPSLGAFVLIGIGGVTAELLKDVALRLAPVSHETAREMIAGLRARGLLDGYRGAPPADVDAAAQTVSALSRLAVDYSDSLRELDVNPLLVLPRGQGVRVADALMIVEA
jgi:acetate---CoA ligase (ADP-forming)